MGVTNLIHKRANYSIVDSNWATIENLGDHNLAIPYISATYNEVISAFGSCSGNVFNNNGVLGTGFANFLDVIGASFSQFANLAYWKNVALDVGTPYASYYRLLTPGTPILSCSPWGVTGNRLFINSGGLGLFCGSGTSDGFKYSIGAGSNTYGTTPGMTKVLGLERVSTGNSPLCGIGLTFITSDNRMGYCRLYYNKSNSNLVWYSSDNTTRIINWLNSLPEPEPENEDDPYNPGGESGTGGGTGNFDGTSDNVDIPSLPTLSAVDTGFITLFNPSLAELQNLANYMWGSLFDLQNWKKLFADPMDAILGMSIVPVAVPDAGASSVKVGNIDTGVTMNKASTQYVEVDCGTLNVNEYWGAYLDYSPYTKAEIYLPYIGTKPLATDDIMNKAVHVVYHIDVLSGGCTAFVKCGNSVLYEYIGHCSCSIPITGRDWTEVVNGVLNIAGSLGSAAAGAASGNYGAAASGIANAASSAINITKPIIERSGSMAGAAGMLGIQTPYIILTRPRQALPTNQNKFMGYPSFITMRLSSCSGYTEIESIHLEGIPATKQEIDEIESLLKGGVIF